MPSPEDPAVPDGLAPHSGSDGSRVRRTLRALTELAKVRLTALVVVTTGFGYLLGVEQNSRQGVRTGSEVGYDLKVLLATAVGTTLVAFAASALNQLIEVAHDRRMHRTRGRPLVTGDLSGAQAVLLAGVTLAAGCFLLFSYAHPWAGILALASLVSYVAIYTPLKRVVSHNTIVGAIPGALPPVIGWAAARGDIDLGGWTLFFIIFVWQIPHFLAIAWIHREDYARGGFAMLSVGDEGGRTSGRVAVVYSLLLIPISVTPSFAGIAGWAYLLTAPIVGWIVLGPALAFARNPDPVSARRLFLATLIYLPLLMGILLLDPSEMPADVATFRGVR